MAKHKLDYFDAFEHMTDLAVQESEILIEALEDFTKASKLIDVMRTLHELEHQGDDINHDLFSQVATDFMPPIDCEDVVELAQALDNIVDYIEDAVTHMYMYDVHEIPGGALKFADLIKKSCEALDACMADFRNFKKSKKFRKLVVDINTYEEEADSLYQKVIRCLHTERRDDFMHVLVWSRVYERMERCCNACETSSNIVATIMLKNV